jgi:hypothetical protein
MTDATTLDWMLDTDPALRWRVERDLAHAPEEQWRATRELVATEGMGAKLLALQDDDGQWDGGAYFPGEAQAKAAGDPDAEGQPWTATTWSLTVLREFGLDARHLAGTAEALRRNAHWEYGDLPYWDGEVDVCINAFTLANGAWLGADVSPIVRFFLEHRMDDGGWNCEWENGSTRSSFHSTLNAVREILFWERTTGSTELTAARHAAEEYLLERHLLRRLHDGEPVGSFVTHLGWPFRYVYSALRAVDHFRSASLHDGTAPDPRMAEAIESIRADRRDDGRWVQETRHPGRVWFELDVPPGEASPWLTFYATRALDWWESATS